MMAPEAVLLLFRNRPTLAAELLKDVFNAPVPSFTRTQIVPVSVKEVSSDERRTEMAVVLEAERAVFAIVVEAQLSRDPQKQYVWPMYLAGVRARYRCPTCFLVVTLDPEMPRWCSRPIETGHAGFVLTPQVLGPEGIPVVTDANQVRVAPELAVLSAMAHGQSEAGKAIALAFLAAAVDLDEDRRDFYRDMLLSSVNEAARPRLKAMKKGYEYQSEFARTYVAKGQLEGLHEGKLEAKAHDVLAVLEARGLEVPPDVRERILASADLAELDRWLRRAAVVSELRLVFETASP